MAAKHSPAPFRAATETSPVGIYDSGEDCIAKVYLTDPTTRKRDDVHAANLALFLASPELLSLAEDVASVLGDLLCDETIGEHDPDESPLVGLLRDARAVIAKAKGGAA